MAKATNKTNPQTITPSKLIPQSESQAVANTDIDKRLQELQSEAQKIREDFLIIFGLLGAVIAFLTAEVQAFKTLDSFASLVGFSSFLVAAVLAFVVGLQVVVRPEKLIAHYWPTLLVIACFMTVSLCSFYFGIHHFVFFIK